MFQFLRNAICPLSEDERARKYVSKQLAPFIEQLDHLATVAYDANDPALGSVLLAARAEIMKAKLVAAGGLT